MSNNDKFIRDTPHGKLMESVDEVCCLRCKYNLINKCIEITHGLCLQGSGYFAKDEIDEKS